MGLFNRKEKAYSLAEAMRKLQEEKKGTVHTVGFLA